MPGPRCCVVSFTDPEGVTHSVEVAAESLFEAAALGLCEFRKCGFAEVIIGPGAHLRVTAKGPATTHDVRVSRLRELAAKRREIAKGTGAQVATAGDRVGRKSRGVI